MTEVAPAPNFGSEIDEHSFIERPSVFHAFLMYGRMFCCVAADACGPDAGCVAATCANNPACNTNTNRRLKATRVDKEIGAVRLFIKCMARRHNPPRNYSSRSSR